jgi:L-lactate dehydrogenase complex protein LldG
MMGGQMEISVPPEKTDSEAVETGKFALSPDLYRPVSGSLFQAFRENAVKVNALVTYAETEEKLVTAVVEWISGNGWNEVVCAEELLRNMFQNNHSQMPLSENLNDRTEVAITGCESLIAQLGSVIVSSAQSGSRRIFIFPPVHIVVAFTSQLTETLEEGYHKTMLKYRDDLPSFISVITGPSRTADIEKTLVLGAHGPVQLHFFVLNDTKNPK